MREIVRSCFRDDPAGLGPSAPVLSNIIKNETDELAFVIPQRPVLGGEAGRVGHITGKCHG